MKTNYSELLPKESMIELMKSYNFKLTDSSLITDFYYDADVVNPFDKITFVNLYFDNNLLISIERNRNNGFTIRIGVDTGWVGGLEFANVELSFDIDVLTFEALKNGFNYIIENQKFYLGYKDGYGKYTIVFIGSVDEIKAYAENLGYEIYNTDGLFDFYFFHENIPHSENGKVLEIYVLSTTQYENLTTK